MDNRQSNLHRFVVMSQVTAVEQVYESDRVAFRLSEEEETKKKEFAIGARKRGDENSSICSVVVLFPSSSLHSNTSFAVNFT